MSFGDFSFIPLIILVICSGIILIQISWRRMIIILAIQYLAAFWLVVISWPLGLALIKLIIGGVVCFVLGSSIGGAHDVEQRDEETGQGNYPTSAYIFRTFLALFGMILAFSLSPGIRSWLPISQDAGMDIVRGGMVLVIAGLLQLGTTTHHVRSSIGLLTILSGFEIIYAAIEASVLVAGLLAAINLGLALVAAYAIAMNMPGGQDEEGATR